MIIELTDPQGQPIYINSDHIIRFKTVARYTEIIVTGEQGFSVQESAKTIQETVNRWPK
ncbi:hypothetical protein ACLEXA_11800 [Pseudescherichia vulneris]